MEANFRQEIHQIECIAALIGAITYGWTLALKDEERLMGGAANPLLIRRARFVTTSISANDNAQQRRENLKEMFGNLLLDSESNILRLIRETNDPSRGEFLCPYGSEKGERGFQGCAACLPRVIAVSYGYAHYFSHLLDFDHRITFEIINSDHPSELFDSLKAQVVQDGLRLFNQGNRAWYGHHYGNDHDSDSDSDDTSAFND